MNRYLASTLLTGFLISATVFSPAQGQEQALQPQGAWAVTKVDRSGQNGNSYCTLSRKYDDGIVLSLGRNQTEEYSLAIDFQKQTFQKDKAVKINLQPGPGQIRAYDMMPTSEKAVVVRLGWDTGFFDALNQSQQMKVKIADKNYAFAMPEIAKGQGDLQECMENLKTASAKTGGKSGGTKDVLDADPVKAAKGFDAAKADDKASAGEINAQKQSPAVETKTAANFSADKKRSEITLNNDDAAPRRPRPPEDQADKQAERPAEKLAKPLDLPEPAAKSPELIRRPEPSTAALAGKQPAAGDSSEIKALQQRMAALNAENAELKRKDDEAASLAKRLAALDAENAALKQKSATVTPETQKQIDALAAEKAALEQKLSAAQQQQSSMAKAEDFAAAQAKAKELEIKNAQLEDTLRQSQTRIAETAINTETRSMKQIVDLQNKLDAAQKDNANLAKQLDAIKLQQEDKGLTLVAGDWNLEQATKRFNEAEREIRRLGLQLEQERTNCNREKAQIESMLFDPAVADQKQIEKLAQLQKELETAQGSIKDNQKAIDAAVAQQIAVRTKELNDRAQALETEKASLSQQIAALQKNAEMQKSSVAAEKARLQTQLAVAHKGLDLAKSAPAESARLKAQVASLQKNSADIQAVTAEKTRLQEQVAALQKASAEMQTVAAEKTRLEAQVASLQKASVEAQAANAEKMRLQEQVASLQKSAGDAQSLTAEKATLAQQVTALQKSLADKDAVVAAATAQQTAMQTQISALQKQAAEGQTANANTARLTQQVAELQKAVADRTAMAATEKTALQTQLDALKVTLGQKDQELYALKSQPKIDPAAADQRVAQEVGKVRAEADQRVAQEIGKARAEADQQMTALKTQNQAMTQNLASLQSALSTKDKQIADLQSQPKTDPAIMKQLADLQTAMAAAKRDADTLRDQNIALRQQADKLQIQLTEVQSNGAARADRVASIQLENDELKRQLAMKDTQSATYQNQLASAQQESAQLKARVSAADTQRTDTSDQIGQLTRQVQQLQRQISSMQERPQPVAARSVSAQAYSDIAPAAGAPQIQNAAMTVPAGGMSGYDRSSIQSLLQKSGLRAAVANGGAGLAGADNFSWSENGVKGVASVKALNGASFDALVNQYIAYQKSQCGGDFASMPSPSNGSAAKQMSLYEVACVSPSQSLSSSMLFFEDQGRFIAISNQIGAADMDVAMDSRDKIASFVRGL